MRAAHSAGGTLERPILTKAMPATVDPDAYKIVSVRLRLAEFECFTRQTEALGVTHSMALRIAMRRIAGFLETDGHTRVSLRQISDHIGDISASLRQIGRIAAREGTVDMERLTDQRAAFAREFMTLDTHLQTILDVSHRRQDGMALLRDATAARGRA